MGRLTVVTLSTSDSAIDMSIPQFGEFLLDLRVHFRVKIHTCVYEFIQNFACFVGSQYTHFCRIKQQRRYPSTLNTVAPGNIDESFVVSEEDCAHIVGQYNH